MADNPTVHVTNQYNEALNVFKLTVPADASADNKDSLYGDMLQVSTVAANATVDYVPAELLETLVFCAKIRPDAACMASTDIFNDTSIKITADDVTKAQAAFKFYKLLRGSPFDPETLSFNDVILKNPDITIEDTFVNPWLKANNQISTIPF